MSNKTRIGNSSSAVATQASREQARADTATTELTMTRRRIRTFEDALSYVQFPDDAPSWASEWVAWLLTGEVPKPEVVEEEEVEEEVEEDAAA